MDIIIGHEYRFKEEFCKGLGIPMYQANERRNELLLWLKNFYEYEIIEGRPIRIKILDVIGAYQPLPRKYNNEMRAARAQEIKQRYTDFTIAHLPLEYKETSQRFIAREVIDDFGYEEYGHENDAYVAKKYVQSAFKENAETNGVSHWVFYPSYEPLPADILKRWKEILSEEKIGEKEAAKAFYKMECGQDISREQGYFKKARERFKEEFHMGAPVYIQQWKKK